MKKVLSIFLAVLMLCSCVALAASAEQTAKPYFSDTWGESVATNDQAIFLYRLQGAGKCKNGRNIYVDGEIVWKNAEDIPDTFMVVPENADEFKAGNLVTLPSVKAKNGQDFIGWQRTPAPDGDTDSGVYSPAAGKYTVKAKDVGRIVEFVAIYEEGEFEEDTFSKVFQVLTKVFGAIIGLIAYQGNIQKGQDFMAKLFSSIAD